ncbi:DNA/RNA non-specific endonuclease [Rhodobacteraceae bacterium]|nr:DNA/RNA non-specific endonuclease [Paracoccaceae bacterium]
MMTPQNQISNLRRNKAAFETSAERAATRLIQLGFGEPTTESLAPEGFSASGPAYEAVLSGHVEGLDNETDIAMGATLEAIILADLRPPYFIADNQIMITGNYDEVALLNAHKATLEVECLKVGRVDLFNHRLPYAGTGWLITDDIVVTNRHVAEVFARTLLGGQYDFRPDRFGQPLRVETNTYQQNKTNPPADYRPMRVIEVLFMARPGEPDFAFLRVDNEADISPIDLAVARAEVDQPIAAVGYPAADPNRNDANLMDDLFSSTYNVKRFSPGLCTGYTPDGHTLFADYTTLGGNSGSIVLDIATQKAVALHFAGVFEETNFAVPADLVWAAMREVRAVHANASVSIPPTQVANAESFSDRNGYSPEFLGDGDLRVDYPGMDQATKDDIAPVSDDTNGILKYTHFSVIQSISRRLPMLTAVNIDGGKAIRLKRKGNWRLDGRIDNSHQVGNELYRHNPLDRGHMVRRMDPGWGDSKAEAQQGEIDTFHYTNSAPQHKLLNQRDWVGLEDYILEASRTRDFKVSVMTGPVFRDNDKTLRKQPGAEDVQIPEHFWKIAAMVDTDTGELSATGYLLTHGELIADLTEAAFVLGEYKTYQVKLSRISAVTGFDFSHLETKDPMNANSESTFGEAVFEVVGPESLRL